MSRPFFLAKSLYIRGTVLLSKKLLFFFFLTFSLRFSQTSYSLSERSYGFSTNAFYKHYEKGKADSLSKLVGTYVEGFIAMAGSVSILKLMRTTTLVSK